MRFLSYRTLMLVFLLCIPCTWQRCCCAVAKDVEVDTPSNVESIQLEDRAGTLLNTFCISCHGEEVQEAGINLSNLLTIDEVKRQGLFERIREVVTLREMPPEQEEHPTNTERELLIQWLDQKLDGQFAKALSEKLKRFEYGNIIDHDELFSGKHATQAAYTEDRRWLISEFIFNEKINSLLNYEPTRTIYGKPYTVHGDSGVHWSPKTERGNKYRRTITNPYLLPQNTGVRYGAAPEITTGHLLTMLGNAKRVAAHMSSEATMKLHYPAMYAMMKPELDHREQIRKREEFLRNFSAMDRLLKDLYGNDHAKLLPKLIRQDIPYPGPPKHSSNGIQKRHDNLEFLGRFDQEDIRAILQGIATYKETPFEVKEDQSKARSDSKGTPVWAPYHQDEQDEFNRILLRCERDWFVEGVTPYRIENRLTTMKLFFDTWDLQKLYQHIEKGNFARQNATPLAAPEMQAIRNTVKKHRSQGDSYSRIIEKSLHEWHSEFLNQHSQQGVEYDRQVRDTVIELHKKVFQRVPKPQELADTMDQLKLFHSKLDLQLAIGKLIESLVLSTEFSYRSEFGTETPDRHGRRMLSPRDASYALSYALTDSIPDETLRKAAQDDRLNTKADYEREIRRMLDRRDRWTIIDENVQAANLNASVTNQPIRKLRFFREFFGYPNAQEVFKDDSRFGAGRHEQAVSRLIDEADMLIEHILEEDQHVFEQLLTTEKFFVYHSGDNPTMTKGSRQLKQTFEYFSNMDWESWEPDDIEPHKDFMLTIWEFQKTRNHDNKSLLTTLKRLMPALVLHFSDGQDHALPYMKMPMGFWHGGNVLGRTGQQMRGEQVTTYWNLNWKTWDYPTEQPARIPNRKGILTHPAWLIAHSQNLETDPIHRGKWIREKLLADSIPDVPITVDAVIPPNPQQTLRQRMEHKTGADYCWRCHQKMDPLGFPFESFDDFGRFRTVESLEHPENLIKEAKRDELNEFGASLAVYKTLPVDSRGVLTGTGDDSLDGEVSDAFDLIDRLAKSSRVRQSIIRHAFRYFLGRNETLSDSKTLIDADQAYLKSNGSFNEVVVSLLTSDSFIYRKPSREE